MFSRLPFFYGWVIVAVAFVTMAVSVSARTSFSLLLPPILDEYGWERAVVAGAFSTGFLMSALFSPIAGRLVDRKGPRLVIQMGALSVGAGMILATQVAEPWQLYLTVGVLVGVGANLMSYTVQSMYLPNWFQRRRGLAISLAFSGVGVGAILVLPAFQQIIVAEGWREACYTLGILTLVLLVPINLLVRKRPQDLGLQPDGRKPAPGETDDGGQRYRIVDPEWVAVEWTLGRAVRTARFWWVALGFFTALVAWYAVQVHQTKYLLEIGFNPIDAAWALGFVAVVAIPGQIALGALSDRIGREGVWALASLGFAITYAALLALKVWPTELLLYVMVFGQGFLGYAYTSVLGPIMAEIFEGPHFGTIFGAMNVAAIGGGAAGPFIAGVIFDATGSYDPAWIFALVCCFVSAFAIWRAAPRKVRSVVTAP
ncbi:MFS transporter [Minwuia thermotolerans]|jgi:MFS family permease|uniref:MFS transporter n=1 Tax=Minwuia thermotolerans TaxID=2056226 RepID=A0A2M9G5X4_9PROT|nr:MFS transporter [Minwuia thermotolerans]ANK82252.1 MAG: MFS transporter [Rhizobiales bacterium NRL2]PJK31113.1 MFS transporter [Minwuia thermotolerans]